MQCNILGTAKPRRRTGLESEAGQRDSPLQVQLIQMLGLKNYFIDKFVFRRKPSKYQIVKRDGKNSLFSPKLYRPSSRLTAEVQLIQTPSHSIPLVYLKHIKPISDLVIIYSHGNSSDLSQSLVFLESLALSYGVDVLGYDYSGYGQSRVTLIGEETIVRDLELVISWIKVPLSKIILWGFSLGSYPTVCNAAKFRVAGMVLQCPIASVNCIFEEGVTAKTKFKEDHFSNLQKINLVKCWTFIVHTLEDQIIPIAHGRLLFQKFSEANGKDRIWFIEVAQAKHNGLHKYFISKHSNDLKDQFSSFIRRIQHDQAKNPKQQDQPLQRLHNKFMLVESDLLEDQQFCEQEYELLAVCETKFGSTPGRKFVERRGYIPRCFD